MRVNIFRILQITVAVGALFLDTSCASVKGIKGAKETIIELTFNDEIVKQQFADLNNGLRLKITSDVSNDDIIDNSEVPTSWLSHTKYTVTPSLRQYVQESASQFVKRLGFKYGTGMDKEYVLNVNVRRFVYRNSTNNATATVTLEYTLTNRYDEVIVPSQSVTGRSQKSSKTDLISSILERAYMKALNDIDWDRIATILNSKPSQTSQTKTESKSETNPKLENTIIRWYIVSSPQGADVTWRVISSTPDVKNTNGNYVGNTPYESTESFDVKGLTYDNAGNVQIEVLCEKTGYLPQKKRFNLRQAIDQKEISAKFNLIKDK